MIPDQARSFRKPEIRYLGQQFTLVGYRFSKHDIERGKAIGRHD
jgi:hypothetical protein